MKTGYIITDSGERQQFASGAVRDTQTGKGRFDLISPFALERLAKHLEAGAEKYTERNWEKGIPISRLLDSALRHINRYRQGDGVEDHLAAVLFNIAAAIHFEEVESLGEIGSEELHDTPVYTRRTGKS